MLNLYLKINSRIYKKNLTVNIKLKNDAQVEAKYLEMR
jgi:hypothetical protein